MLPPGRMRAAQARGRNRDRQYGFVDAEPQSMGRDAEQKLQIANCLQLKQAQHGIALDPPRTVPDGWDAVFHQLREYI